MKDLPLNGRSYDELMTLNAGVVNYTSERSGGVGTSNSSVGNMFAVFGRRPQENLFLLNGIEFTGASLINNHAGRRQRAVAGRGCGARVQRGGGYLRRGVRQASGRAGEHGDRGRHQPVPRHGLRISAQQRFRCAQFFRSNGIPEFQRNEFGAALGGPIRKDKFFIFGNYEGFRQNLGLSDLTLVPDNAARASRGSQCEFRCWRCGRWHNGPELGGGIAEAFSNPPQHIREDFGTTRFDANLSSRDTFFARLYGGRLGRQHAEREPAEHSDRELREQVASVEEQHIFSPTILNTARFGYSRAGYFFTGQMPVNIPGWVTGDPIGAVVIGGGTASNGASQITLAGTNNGSNLTAVRNLFTVRRSRRAHARACIRFEAGVWLQRIQANDNLVQSQYGQASFSSLTSFLQGTIATFSVVPAPTPVGWRSTRRRGFRGRFNQAAAQPGSAAGIPV